MAPPAKLRNNKPNRVESIMLHHIFQKSNRYNIWHATNIKAWLHQLNNAIINVRVNKMKGYTAQLEFLNRFPQYFEIFPQQPKHLSQVKVRNGARCEHCHSFADEHTTSFTPTAPAIPTSSAMMDSMISALSRPPNLRACGHDDLFRAIHHQQFHRDNTTIGHFRRSLKRQAYYTEPCLLGWVKSVTSDTLNVYLQLNAQCYAISELRNGAIKLLKTDCPCMKEIAFGAPDVDPIPSATSNSTCISEFFDSKPIVSESSPTPTLFGPPAFLSPSTPLPTYPPALPLPPLTHPKPLMAKPEPTVVMNLTFNGDYQGQYAKSEEKQLISEIDHSNNFTVDEDTQSLVSLLPQTTASKVLENILEVRKNLVEVVMDNERPVSLRFSDANDDVHLKEDANIKEALQSLQENITAVNGSFKPVNFMSDNRLGISKMLHRISAMKSRSGEVIGLTYRVGRSVEGVTQIIQDILAKIAGYGGQKPGSVLFLGRPGVGKTTVLREVSRILAGDTFKKRVVVIDTSNEIAGDGDTPHACIGRARRVQVPHRADQHSIMIETVQNHNPQIIIVDEIGSAQEVEAARTISQRGVTLVGTAHGEDIHTLLKNPILRGLVGGTQPVILSANEAKNLNSDHGTYKKSRLERAGAPTFDIVIELRERHKWRILTNVAEIVDALLAHGNPLVETRMIAADKSGIRSVFANEKTQDNFFA